MDQGAAMILLNGLSYSNDVDKEARLTGVTAEEWRKVVDLANEHKVAPLLCHRLRRLNSTLPSQLFNELEQLHAQNTFRNMRLYQELHKLLGWLIAEQIPVIVLKGAYLASEVYESVGLRTMADIDILLKKNDILRVQKGLFSLGYVHTSDNNEISDWSHHFVYLLPESSFYLEIHWLITDAKFYPEINIDIEGLWGRAYTISLAQTPALAFSYEDLLLHLCLHAALHMYLYKSKGEMRIRMLCDIGEIVRRFGTELDWQILGVRARQWGIAHPVYLVLRHARDFLNIDIPIDWLDSLKQKNFDEGYIKITRQLFFSSLAEVNTVSTHQVVDRLWGLKGFGQKLVLVRERLLPSRQSMAKIYPVPESSWRIYIYYPKRWAEAIANNLEILWKLACGDPKTRRNVERPSQLKELRDWLISG